MSTKGMFRCLGGILLLAAPVATRPTFAEPRQESPRDEHIAGLIERLEMGMSALEELERHDALEIVQRIANELRAGQRGERDESEEVKAVRRRLKVMRTAVEAYVEANRHDLAEQVELAMHARELAIEGIRGEKANQVRERAPNRGQLAELLIGAGRLLEEWGMPDRAQALAELSEVYARQWKRQQQAKREEPLQESEGDGDHELDSLARRMDIIRFARDAYAKNGDRRHAAVLNDVIHYGELALGGVDDERLGEAAAAVPEKPALVRYVRGAARLYFEWGAEERGAACRELAGYYLRQLEAEEGETREGVRVEQERDVRREGPAGGDTEDLNRRIEILDMARGALAEAGREEWAHTMERFLHAAHLQRDGADGVTMTQALEGLSMGMTIELLQKASGYYAEWGWEGRAAACNRLAEFYAARERGRAVQERETEERLPSRNLEDQAQRLDILRFARAAHAEAGHLDATDILERAIQLGELQQTEASPARIAQAAEGLSMERITELVLGASGLYHEWGREDRQAACYHLAEFYRQRDQGSGAEGHDVVTQELGGEDEVRARLRELLQVADQLEAELQDIRATILHLLGG